MTAQSDKNSTKKSMPITGDSEDLSLARAIDNAKTAAAEAGIDTRSLHAHLGRRIGDDPASSMSLDNAADAQDARTSFAFELDNLPSAAAIGDIEAKINEIDGINIRIVYSTAMAWVSAPRSIEAHEISAMLEEFGMSAVLTEASLQRRIAWTDVEDGRHIRAQRRQHRRTRARNVSARLRKQIEDDAKAIQEAKRSGYLDKTPERGKREKKERSHSGSTVLFTARALLTARRFWVSLVFSIPVLLISYYPDLQFDYWQWVLIALSIPVVFYGAWPFHRATIAGAARKKPALDSASSAAVLLAWIWSVCLVVFTSAGVPSYRMNPQWISIDAARFDEGTLFFDVACGMTLLLLGGRLLSHTTRVRYADVLAKYRPDPSALVTVATKNRKTGQSEKQQRAIQSLNVGDDIIIEPGEIIPVDGAVIGGHSEVDVRPFGIKSFSVKVKSTVYAGSVNKKNRLKIRVRNTGYRTWIAAVHRWIDQASRQQDAADERATYSASILVPISLFLAACTFTFWSMGTGNINHAFAAALAVLGVVAPVALAVSASVATRQGLETAARRGILIAQVDNLRQLDQVDAVIFNRVGTLAENDMIVETVTADRGENPELVLRVAGAMALESNHPLSRALVRASREARDQSTDESIPHRLEASHHEFDDDGNFHAMVEIPITDSEGDTQLRSVEAYLWRPRNLSQLSGRLAAAALSGGTPIVVGWKGKDRGVITLQDHAKSDATEAVDTLEAMGIETMMMSRDTYPVARRYGDSVGVSHVLAGVQPRDKPQAVRSIRIHGVNAAVVGDPSIKECFRVANVGMLLGALENVDNPSEVDHMHSDIVFLEDRVAPIPWLFRFARRINKIVHQNFVFAWGYNVLGLIAACAGLIHPMIATALMLASSILIELHSRLSRKTA
ncbi:cation-translocating P-type ATPase [Corynebacterium sp. sy017]|nr:MULTISPECIES: HAD family hydrolase [unclassified Corynebacterium]MBP3089318.1 cation-translocating P-type ATPase [Corynebacterium sp. sy017]TSD90982.1 cation-translocating P-type ATPase [Corynebacterium sp. SY003]